MDPLHCLHDGTWVALSDITRIIPRHKDDDRPSVLVCMGRDFPVKVFFETERAAIQYAAELAALVNERRAEVVS